MSLLERLDKAAVHFAAHGAIGRSSPFCYQWTRDDTRQLLEDAAKEIRQRSALTDEQYKQFRDTGYIK